MNVRVMWGIVVASLAAANPGGAATGEEPSSAIVMMDPVVVTASPLVSALSEVGSSVTVLSAEVLEAQAIRTVPEALKLVPGLDVVETGGPGQTAEVYLRGLDSGRSLVMINGVVVNDPINPGRTADLARLTVDNVERIEILRGPQGAVYGAGALGGVVNIITKKQRESWHAGLDVSGGQYSTWNTSAQVGGNHAGLEISLAGSWETTEGFSTAKRTQPEPVPVPDLAPNGHRHWTGDLSLGYAILPTWHARLAWRGLQADYELDRFGGSYGDATDYTGRSDQHVLALDSAWEATPWWRQKASLGLSQSDRNYRNQGDETVYHGRSVNADWNHQLAWVPWNALAVGANYRQEQGRADEGGFVFPERSNHQFGYYATDRLQLAGFTLEASARWDVHDQFGTYATTRVAPVYTWAATGTSVKGAWGTGFNPPTLYQLYSSFGNSDLRPEKAAGWDAGIEQTVFDMVKLGATYFQNDFENQIYYDTDLWQYVNIKVQTKGWEAFAAAEPLEDLVVRIGYTKLTANDITRPALPLPLKRRADYRASLDVGYRWQAMRFQVAVQHVGPRWDADYDPLTFAERRVVLAPYTLVNLVAAYAPVSLAEVYLRINNLLDADYVEVLGYNTPRFGVYGGVKLAWK